MGLDLLSPSALDTEEGTIDYGIRRTRQIYATVGVGVGRAQSLGRVGGPEALRQLARLPESPESPVGRDVRMARVLLSYRHGIPDTLVEALPMTRFSGRATQPIDWGQRPRLSARRVLESARLELPGMPLTAASVQTFVCSDVNAALALDATLAVAQLRSALSAPHLIGALLRDRVCSERYSLDAYLLADDREGTGGARPMLWLVRPDGTLVHGGRAEVQATGCAFSITQSRAPYGSPVRVVGRFDAGTHMVTVTESVVGRRNTPPTSPPNRLPSNCPDRQHREPAERAPTRRWRSLGRKLG